MSALKNLGENGAPFLEKISLEHKHKHVRGYAEEHLEELKEAGK
jgi:hypothetical protein